MENLKVTSGLPCFWEISELGWFRLTGTIGKLTDRFAEPHRWDCNCVTT